MFKLEKSETVNAMYNQYNDIFVGRKGCCKVTGMATLNHKLLLSIPKVIEIEKVKDLATMSMEELLDLSSPMSFWINNKKKKDLVFRILMQEEDEDIDKR